jgi:hypothetical protein
LALEGSDPAAGPQPATTDEILDSLTRQAELMEKSGHERTVGLQTILEVALSEEPRRSSNVEPSRTFEPSKTRSLGRSAFALMLLMGLAFLWIYSRLSQILNSQSPITLQQTISRAGFADRQRIALIAFCAFIIVLLAHHKKQDRLTPILN